MAEHSNAFECTFLAPVEASTKSLNHTLFFPSKMASLKVASPKMVSLFKFFGVNLKDSVPVMQVPVATPELFGVNLKNLLPATQVPLATPVTTANSKNAGSIEILQQQVVLVASRMDVEDAPMDMEGVLQDVLRQFKKGCEEVTCEYFAAMKRMEDNLCWQPCDSDSARDSVDGMRPMPDT